ncbi:hypothetical protein C8J56DRAFT_954323 [Mycena floridula]|nr:hypothetical protein C8J56DRAFT_954323 [Mycena floridula]
MDRQHRRSHRRVAANTFKPTSALDARKSDKQQSDDDFLSWLLGGGDETAKTTATTKAAGHHTTAALTSLSQVTTSTSTSTTPSLSSTVAPTTSTTKTTALQTKATTKAPSVHSTAAPTKSATHANAAASASASASAVPVAATSNVGSIIGGLAAGIVAVALICCIISYVMRRRRRNQDPSTFDPSAFRRSAVLMQDPPTHQDTVAAGFNPRPAPAFVSDRPATFGTLYGPPGAAYLAAQARNQSQPTTPTSPYSSPFSSPSPEYQAAPHVLTHKQSTVAPVTNNSSYVELERSSRDPFQTQVEHDNRVSVVSQSEDIHGINAADFPVPPSPALTVSSRYNRAKPPSPIATGPSHSPLAAANSPVTPRAAVTRPETVYDVEDAYGGF